MKLSDVITNPVRMKILQFLQVKGDATTKQICEELPDVPQPTIYRHINYLLKEEVLIVKSERKVRGSLERLLTLNEEKFAENADIADSAYQFLMGLYGSFRRYSEKGNSDPVADMLCLRTSMLTLTDESYANFLQELRAVFDKYSKSEENGKNRSFSIISAPVTEEKKK
ncbi:MAG: helix-turn-helix domain-containing protein [Ruminococcus sp.]|nr:helix-turn-helix domain-containing protein [Ruminococcus sp.]